VETARQAAAPATQPIIKMPQAVVIVEPAPVIQSGVQAIVDDKVKIVVSAAPSSSVPPAPPTPLRIKPAIALTPNKMVKGTVGFWHLVLDSAGVWWLSGPQVNLEFMNTVTTVQP